MLHFLIAGLTPAAIYYQVEKQRKEIKQKKKAQKEAGVHVGKIGRFIQSIIEDEDIAAGPSLDADAKNCFFGMHPDLGMQLLLSPEENIRLTRLVKSAVKEYSYKDENLEYDDKSIVKFALGTQRTRATEYLEYWLDQGLTIPENITRWYLEMLGQQ